MYTKLVYWLIMKGMYMDRTLRNVHGQNITKARLFQLCVALGEHRRNNIRTSMLRLFQWKSEGKSWTMMGYTISPTLKLVRHHWFVLRCLLVSSPSPNPLVPKPPKSCPIQVLLDHFPQYLGPGLSSCLSNHSGLVGWYLFFLGELGCYWLSTVIFRCVYM